MSNITRRVKHVTNFNDLITNYPLVRDESTGHSTRCPTLQDHDISVSVEHLGVQPTGCVSN